jgi:hypothetical protein
MKFYLREEMMGRTIKGIFITAHIAKDDNDSRSGCLTQVVC